MKKRLQHRCFLVKFRTALSTEYLRWLLIVSWFHLNLKRYYMAVVDFLNITYHLSITLKGLLRNRNIWDKLFKNGPIKICGRQPLKNLKEYGLLTLQIFQRLCSTNFTWSILLNTLSHMSDGKTIIPGLTKNNWIIDN